MNRLADLRPNIETVDQAKRLMADLARVTCVIEVAKARLELTLAKDKALYAEKVAEPSAELDALEANLRSFIVAHKSIFQKPRKVATEFGSFGLQDTSEVIITDEEACLKHCIDSEMEDCFKSVISPIKSGLKVRLEAGGTIPGCSLKTGDTAVYKVAKSVIEREVEQAIPERKRREP